MEEGRIRRPLLFDILGDAQAPRDQIEDHCVRGLRVHPVPEYDQPRTGGQRHVDLRVEMPEDEEIDFLFPGEPVSELVQRLIRSLEEIFLIPGQAAVTGPSLSYLESQSRMNQ